MKPFLSIICLALCCNCIAQNNLKEILAIKAAFDSLNSTTFTNRCRDTLWPTDEIYRELHEREWRKFRKGKIKELKPDILEVYFTSEDACLIPFENYLKRDSIFSPVYNAYRYSEDTLKFNWIYGPPKECNKLITAVATILGKEDIAIYIFDTPGHIPWGWYLQGELKVVTLHVNADNSIRFVRSELLLVN